MGYLRAILSYLRTPKGKHDFLDYIRAVIIITAVIMIVRVALELI